MILCTVLMGACDASISVRTATSGAYIPSETAAMEIPLVNTTNTDELVTIIENCKARKEHAHLMATSGRILGYVEDHPVLLLAKDEWNNASEQQEYYQSAYNEIIAAEWAFKSEEYPEATKIWRYLKDLGYNDYVCAGIMGNIMAEVGGQTLNIEYRLTTNKYYGICQWSRSYLDIWGGDLAEQLDYLRDTIQYEIDTFGFCYKKGFVYDSFLNLKNEKNAALAFAKSYERCGSGSYSIRQKNATKAYEYFVTQ